jgi:glycosyltransferase involved in cell wall biosynthesis
MESARLCVAWFRFSLNGSIARFVRFARTVAPFGHRVDFLSVTGETDTDWPDFPGPVLGPDDLGDRRWDAVLVPGAGNPADPLERLGRLRDPRFGRRIQHVLNDPTRRERFLAVNRILDPDVVVFNNGHWRPDDYRTFSAAAFRTVPGAVDTRLFRPAPGRPLPRDPGRWIVGAFAKKNLAPVLDALDRLPPAFRLRIFGTVPGELRDRVDAAMAAGRLVSTGERHGEDLVRFYRGLDLMVTTETEAGWCNAAAEAMAVGVPTLASRAGTIDFVVPDRNAVVLRSVDGETIAREIVALAANPGRLRRMAERATDSMRRWDWGEWSARNLEIAREPIAPAYYRVPELGLHGKWEPTVRLAGLEPVLEEAAGSRVLDLGAAEGLVSAEMARRGATRIHAFEKEPSRVAAGARLLADRPGLDAVFRPADLGDWDSFATAHADVLEEDYDIVLFLGLYHHLPKETRASVLDGAAARARKWLAVRTPPDLAEAEDLIARCERAGLRLRAEREGYAAGNLGWLGLFRREAATRPAAVPPVPVPAPVPAPEEATTR